jgi:hypothetical protein
MISHENSLMLSIKYNSESYLATIAVYDKKMEDISVTERYCPPVYFLK